MPIYCSFICFLKMILPLSSVDSLAVSSFKSVYSGYACEQQGDLMLWCNSGVIEVLSANFGRTDGQRCASWTFNETSCLTPNTLPKIKQMCDLQTICYVPSVSGVWGDPCPTSHKVVEATWICGTYGNSLVGSFLHLWFFAKIGLIHVLDLVNAAIQI